MDWVCMGRCPRSRYVNVTGVYLSHLGNNFVNVWSHTPSACSQITLIVTINAAIYGVANKLVLGVDINIGHLPSKAIYYVMSRL